MKLKGKSKYNAQKVEYGDFTFDSKKEYDRYRELLLLQRAGKIEELQVKPTRYYMNLNSVRICSYTPDFEYNDTETGEHVVEDVKGMRTDVYKLKKKMMKAFHGIEIKET